MVKKDQKWDWTEKQEEVFRELKERFTKELVLTAPDLDKRGWKWMYQTMVQEGCYLWSVKISYGDQWCSSPSH